MTKLSDNLAKRIKKEFGIEVVPTIHRIYAGRHQKADGAWSWFMMRKDNGIGDVGSQWTAKEIMKWKKWDKIKPTHNEISIVEG